MASVPNGPDGAKDSGSMPIPSDNEIPYTVNTLGKAAFPGPDKQLPGHKQADPRALQAAAAARWQADKAEAQAKSDAQFRADTQGAGRARPTFTPAPRRKGK